MVALLIVVAAGTLDAKSYTAERFDSLIRVLPGGAIEVTETIVFTFEDGTFTYVFRELPTRRTDGIEVISARMDERDLPFGNGVESGRSPQSIAGSRHLALCARSPDRLTRSRSAIWHGASFSN